MLLIDELLLQNNYFGRNMHKMHYFNWKIAKIPQTSLPPAAPPDLQCPPRSLQTPL